MEKNNEKMAKMASEADGNVVGESFIIQPEKNLSAKLGILFGVIEIYNANDVFWDGFLAAVNDLKTEYYLPPISIERGVEKRFEEAISRANRRIFSAVNQSIEEIDLRNISAAIGLYHDNKIYLSSAGRIKGLFYRRKKNSELLIMDILSGNGEARFRPEPEKIFANILSGELKKNDALLLINEEFLGFFSQKELGETVLAEPPAAAVGIINAALREKVAKKNFYAVIISPAAAAETETPIIAPAAEPLGPAVSTKPFRDSAAAAGQIGSRIAPDALPRPAVKKALPTQQSIDQLLFTQVRTEKYLTPSLLPQWQKILLVVLAAAKKSFSYALRQLKKSSRAGIKMIAAGRKKRVVAPGLEKKPQPEKKAAKESAAEERETPGSPAALPLAGAERINYFLNAQIEKFLGLKRGQQIMLIIGLILIYLFSQSVVMIGRATATPTSGSAAESNIAKQIETQLDSAEALNIFNDEAGAVRAIKNARELLAQIPDKRLNKSFKNNLRGKIDQAAKALQKINYSDNPAVGADFSTGQAPVQLAGLARTGKIFWAFDNLSRTLYRLDPATGNITLATTTAPSGIKKLTAIDDKNLILLAEGKIYYKYDITKRTAAKTKPAKDWFQIKLSAAASPLIDPPLASSTIAMSVMSETYSFYLDGGNGRVVALDKNGALKRQFYSDKFKGADAIAAAYKEKKLWVFNAGQAYQVDLDF